MTAARAARASALTYRLCWIAESGEPAAEESQTRNVSKASAPCPAVCSACRKTRGTRGEVTVQVGCGSGRARRCGISRKIGRTTNSACVCAGQNPIPGTMPTHICGTQAPVPGTKTPAARARSGDRHDRPDRAQASRSGLISEYRRAAQRSQQTPDQNGVRVLAGHKDLHTICTHSSSAPAAWAARLRPSRRGRSELF